LPRTGTLFTSDDDSLEPREMPSLLLNATTLPSPPFAGSGQENGELPF
jgi:hypothetical protein